jgi:hydrogenase maturation protein HypF
MLLEILAAIRDHMPATIVSTRFHHSLVAAIEILLEKAGLQHLVLSGGVFQNCFLLETLKRRAAKGGYQVWSQSRIPPNDAGLAVGQLAWMSMKEHVSCV